MNAGGCKTDIHKAKTQALQSEKNDHMMHETHRKEDVHVMPTNLPRQLGNSIELEQASLPTEL